MGLALTLLESARRAERSGAPADQVNEQVDQANNRRDSEDT